MCGISKPGFSLIEIIIAVLIVGILISIGSPRFMTSTSEPIDDVAEQINKLTRLAYIRAILTGKVHRIVFRFAQNPMVQLEVSDGEQGDMTFRAAKDVIIKSSFAWSDRFEILHFVIRGKDDARGGLLKDAWFYIMPSGFAQSVTIGIR
jgi:prepilin-type N-terminal cleavage/methylation domain-containing protein